MFKRHRFYFLLLILFLSACTKQETFNMRSGTQGGSENLTSTQKSLIKIDLDCEDDSYVIRNGGRSMVKYKFTVENDTCYFSNVLFLLQKNDKEIELEKPRLFIDNKPVPATATIFNDSINLVARHPAKNKYGPGEHLLELRFISFGEQGDSYHIDLMENNLRFVDRNRFFVPVENTPLIGPAMIFK